MKNNEHNPVINDHSIPERCSRCPRILHLKGLLDSLILEREATLTDLSSKKIIETATQLMASHPASGKANISEPVAGKIVAAKLNILDEDILGHQNSTRSLVKHCMPVEGIISGDSSTQNICTSKTDV